MTADATSQQTSTLPPILQACEQQILDAYAAGDITRLAETCNMAELVHAMHSRQHPFPGLHLLALLAAGDIVNARLLWRRTPVDVRESDADFKAAWRAGSALWKKDWAAVYRALCENDFAERLRPIAGKVVESTREAAIELIEKAFEVVSVREVVMMLGMKGEVDVQNYCTSKNLDWEFTDGFVKPRRREGEKKRVLLSDHGRSLGQLRKLTEQIVRLHVS